MFHGDAANLAFSINVQERVLVEVTNFRDIYRSKLDMQCIGILKIFNLHGLNDLSKNALWTVSPSGKSITRKCFPPASGIGTLNPIQLDDRSIHPFPHLFEVSRELHEPALRERTLQSSVSA
jgi:hypothetical protein